jgi:nucleoside-diphosphate-sugar epimerase
MLKWLSTLLAKHTTLKDTSESQDYYEVNTELTKKVFDAFIASEAKVFITLSSVKAVADEVEGVLTEDHSHKSNHPLR